MPPVTARDAGHALEGRHPSAVARELLDLLPTATPRAQDHIIGACERHGVVYLERLLARARRVGPDGEVLRDDRDITRLEIVVTLLREIKL